MSNQSRMQASGWPLDARRAARATPIFNFVTGTLRYETRWQACAPLRSQQERDRRPPRRFG